MKLNKIKVELILETGDFAEALSDLSEGLKSHGSDLTPEASEFFSDWLKRHMVTSMDSKISELSRRLSQYECVEHDPPKFGECDTCDSHSVDEEWKSPTP